MATVIDAIIRLQDQMTDKLKSVNDSLKKTERMSKATSKSIKILKKPPQLYSLLLWLP